MQARHKVDGPCARKLVLLGLCVAWGCGSTQVVALDGGDESDAGVDAVVADTAAPPPPADAAAPADAAPDTAPGDTGIDARDTGTPKPDSGAALTVFITSAIYPANLGGLAGADAKCQSVATASGLTGTYAAWLSTAGTAARVRLTHGTLPYALVDGTRIANDWDGLVSGNLLHAIDRNELGGTPPDSTICPLIVDGGTVHTADGAVQTAPAYYSATDVNGNIVITGWSDCTGWTSTAPLLGTTFGGTVYTNISWSQSCGSSAGCTGSASLLCIQQ